ncbi:52K protein [Duck adenovirus 1]|uniref:52K protein n=1 Tax=Duck adenovirus 1 TaxID=130329 RepID=O11416_DADV1|nr:52K protein [Duck atadenovirus A]AP_000082.1 52K [Duck atadenovirus A]AGS11268.1 52K protein [Duck adenovirus 1]AJA72328.1 52K protein [Duck adenovirus 1]AJA72357.1 52K protein [Duck adenovirus 1]AJA72386.1 52K protein [Duck adenovirus 1]AJA72415.1 52K protein [Duck adenovirus 1]
MHPIMKTVRTAVANEEQDGTQCPIDCGIANKGDGAFSMRKQQRDDRVPVSAAPPVDVFRSPSPKMSEERDLMYHSGNAIDIDTNRKLEVKDFSPDIPGSSAANRHIQAAELYRNAKYTKDVETWAHDTFIATCRQLLRRPAVPLGLLYLTDFLHNYVQHPPRHELAIQFVAIQQHVENSVLRRLLSRISEKNDKGQLTQQWFMDLVQVLEMIVEEETSVSTQLSAICVACNRLALHFAKKASGGHYPTADKLAKTNVYFRRIITAVLALADSLGCYERNTVPRQPLKRSKRMVESGDDTYMFSLRNALEGPETDDEDNLSQDYSSDSDDYQDSKLRLE